jgi:uncharacterized membrane protein YgdD (TMEM256/DUF423 family)
VRLSSRAAGALGAVLMGLAIAVGAFGAHTLEGRVPEARIGTLETAVRYQAYAGLGLVAMSLVGRLARGRAATAAAQSAALLALGVLLFSGALYLLVAGGPGFLGMVAPVGGFAMILAWLWLAIAIWREPLT